jgi:hypothetical protein
VRRWTPVDSAAFGQAEGVQQACALYGLGGIGKTAMAVVPDSIRARVLTA